MIKLVFRTLSVTLLFLLVFAESNMLNNKHVFFEPVPLHQLILASLALLLFLISLKGLSGQGHARRFLSWIQILLVSMTFFLIFSEAAILDFSGMIFGPEVIYHMNWHAFELGVKEYWYALLLFVLLLVVINIIIRQINLNGRLSHWLTFTVSVGVLVWGGQASILGRIHSAYTAHQTLRNLQQLDADTLAQYAHFGIQPIAVKKHQIEATAPAQPQNLIVIYLESFSAILADNQHPDLTPHIQQLKSQHLTFPNYISTAGFTMDGLIGAMCGLTANMAAGNNSMVGNNPVAQVPCLGDVLSQAGYRQIYMGGALKSFAGKGDFLLSHGFDEVWGWEDFRDRPEYQDKDSHSWWGLHDQDLFAKALEQIKSLKQEKDPFHLSMLSLSTHLKGFPSPDCPQYKHSDDRYLQAIHCTDFLLGQFINQLEQEGITDNTLIYITGDHGIFNTNYTQQLFGKAVANKRLFGMLLGGSPNHTPQALYDLAPFVLDQLKIRHNVQFIQGRANRSAEQAYLTRHGSYKGGQKLEYSHFCNGSNLPCNPTDALNTVYAYLNHFNGTQSFKLKHDSVLTIKINDKKHITAISLAGERLETEFVRQGFYLDQHQLNKPGFLVINSNSSQQLTDLIKVDHANNEWLNALDFSAQRYLMIQVPFEGNANWEDAPVECKTSNNQAMCHKGWKLKQKLHANGIELHLTPSE